MGEWVKKRLAEIEVQYGVKIIYAADGGSRAFGFASETSDYDVRFIYYYPLKKYLSVDQVTEVIDKKVDETLEVHGWDLLKAMRLFQNTNPSFIEWLFSPIVYLEKGEFAWRCRDLAIECCSLKKLTYHYLNMTKQNCKKYIEGKEMVSVKHYLYVLRSILCIKWIREFSAPPPTSFLELIEGSNLPKKFYENINNLIFIKKKGMSEIVPFNDMINKFIEQEIAISEQIVETLSHRVFNKEELNKMMWSVVGVQQHS
ncbi:nucleotidyltransferase domain-containing protein [Bacillus taeanensis]|uniref:Nucleotidyltransferase domain-containing protein n=1 Tax=Bacillus taeanensis TaxID=273032 RepID=A0A366XXW3_9BACI|nr:nucleotidyltransferase domain-containing protein [Bacillus taeanensis]RBW71240.1 nucleotidyltransferase domain-containing protein [Bacillus taeanensis]